MDSDMLSRIELKMYASVTILASEAELLQIAVVYGFKIEGHEWIKQFLPDYFWEPRQDDESYIRLISLSTANNIVLIDHGLSPYENNWEPVFNASSELCRTCPILNPKNWYEINSEYLIQKMPDLAFSLHGSVIEKDFVRWIKYTKVSQNIILF